MRGRERSWQSSPAKLVIVPAIWGQWGPTGPMTNLESGLAARVADRYQAILYRSYAA